MWAPYSATWVSIFYYTHLMMCQHRLTSPCALAFLGKIWTEAQWFLMFVCCNYSLPLHFQSCIQLWHTHPKALVSPSRYTGIHINLNYINLKNKCKTIKTITVLFLKPQIHLVLKRSNARFATIKSKRWLADHLTSTWLWWWIETESRRGGREAPWPHV